MSATQNQTLSVLTVLTAFLHYTTAIPTMMFIRNGAREKRGIEGSMFGDCCVMTFCGIL